MNTSEKNYDFRKRLLEVHKKDIRNTELTKSDDEFEFTRRVVISVEEDADDVVLTAAKDFCDYLFVSMNVSVLFEKGYCEDASVILRLKKDGENLGDGNGYMGSRIVISDRIEITGFDSRGIAQALYYLEDVMTFRKAPFVKKGTVERRTKFSPRMIHSGYGIDWFPNEHLASIAHAGMDAILLFVKGTNLTTTGFVDMNELIHRASKYGLDVYAYSYLKNERHPDDPDAESFYEGTYGKLFDNCPGFKGVILVGESCAFPSKDPHTTGSISYNVRIPGKVHPGFWPCEDYPEFLELLKKIIYKRNSNAEIVLWTYNWASTPMENRVALMNRIPKDISVILTFELGEYYEIDGIMERTADYTISRVGPAPRFVEEIKAAKEAGLKIYTMSNTGGLTWDFGTVPYEPFPYQWQRRHDKMIEMQEKYGLCGCMESHHFGFWPSVISELAKWNFTNDKSKPKNIIREILVSHYGEENAESLEKALLLWSEAIDHYIAVNSDQYGPFRIGPAYPLNFTTKDCPPSADYAHFGASILDPEYSLFTNNVPLRVSIPQLGIRKEMEEFEEMYALMEEGIAVIESIESKNDELSELLELGKYIACFVRTAINVKKFCIARLEMNASHTAEDVKKYLDLMETIALDEIANAKSVLPYVRHNSRLGWEPSMEYLCDEEHILWKINQVEKMIEHQIGGWRKGLSINL